LFLTNLIKKNENSYAYAIICFILHPCSFQLITRIESNTDIIYLDLTRTVEIFLLILAK